MVAVPKSFGEVPKMDFILGLVSMAISSTCTRRKWAVVVTISEVFGSTTIADPGCHGNVDVRMDAGKTKALGSEEDTITSRRSTMVPWMEISMVRLSSWEGHLLPLRLQRRAAQKNSENNTTCIRSTSIASLRRKLEGTIGATVVSALKEVGIEISRLNSVTLIIGKRATPTLVIVIVVIVLEKTKTVEVVKRRLIVCGKDVSRGNEVMSGSIAKNLTAPARGLIDLLQLR